MAANTIPFGKERAPIHVGEHLLTPGYTTDVELHVPPTIEGPKRTDRSWGRVWLTDQRIIFIAIKRKTDDINAPRAPHEPKLHSLIIPYETIKENEFKLPFFQANHEVISFVPDPTHPKPNLPDPGVDSALTVKLTLADGLGHKLFKRVEKEREAWVRKWRDSECLPVYTPSDPAHRVM